MELTHPGQFPFLYDWCKKNFSSKTEFGDWGITPIDKQDYRGAQRQMAFVFKKPNIAQQFQNQVYLLDRRVSPSQLSKINDWSSRLLNIQYEDPSNIRFFNLEKWFGYNDHYFNNSLGSFSLSYSPNIAQLVTDFCLENFDMFSWGLVVTKRMEPEMDVSTELALVFDNKADINYFNLTFDLKSEEHAKINYYK